MPPDKAVEATIQAGVGGGEIAVGRSSKADVISAYGEVFRTIHHKKHSVEMAYEELGLSFFFLQNDPKETITYITAKHPFTGKTCKGILIGESTMQDVIAAAAYGKPNYWNADPGNTYTALYTGIRFRIERETSLPRYPVDEGVHLPRKIIEIMVVEPA